MSRASQLAQQVPNHHGMVDASGVRRMNAVQIGALLWVASTTSLYRAQGPVAVDLGFAGYSSDESRAIGRTEAAVNQIEEAWLSVERLRFHDTTRCDDPGRRPDVLGPVFVEVVGGRVVGLAEKLSLEARRYSTVDGAFRVAQPKDEAPSVMHGASIVIRGRRADGVRFVIRSRRADSVDLRASTPRGFAVRETDTRIFVGIDLAAWLRGVDLHTAEVDQAGDGRIIRIDDRSNRELLRVFERNVLSGIALFRDEDADGLLSVTERSRDKQLASGRKPGLPVVR